MILFGVKKLERTLISVYLILLCATEMMIVRTDQMKLQKLAVS